ncbi:MAG: FkbM family methyltransferase [archaeon]
MQDSNGWWKAMLEERYRKFKEAALSKEDYIKGQYKEYHFLFELSKFLQGKHVKSIELSEGKVLITTPEGYRFYIEEGDERTAPIEAINFGSYEKEEIELMKKILKKDFTILDIGANIGWYSIHLASSVKKIIAFEPLPQTFKRLQDNLKLNNIKNIEINNFGLGEKEDTFDFYYYPSTTVAASMRDLYTDKEKKVVKCQVKVLDHVIKEKVDFIKCDVEGAELSVLKGALNTLKRDKPILFLEMLRKWSQKFRYHPNDIIKLLIHRGYECYAISEKLNKIAEVTDETKETNFLFIDPKKHKVPT